VTAFNSTSTKALASLVNVGTTASPSYALTIVSNKEGTQDGTISVDTSAVQIAPALSTSTSTAATDAQFSVSGITGTITRSTNAVSDVIPGVTLNIRSAGTSIIAVKDDPTTTVTKIQDFVDSFNDIVKFKTENNTITQTQSGRDIKTTFGALGETRVDENAIQGIRDALISSSYSNGSSIKVFADLGITTQRDGTLALNTDTLKSALSSESNSVKNILQNFGNTVALTGGTIDVYTRFNGLIEINRNNNTTAIDSSNARISSIEQLITRDEDAARARFARLEAVIGNFQSQQARLTSALAGLQ
jgi:flagellar hook-associated protein 2